MRTVSYTISPNLQQTLKQIEAIRARILISPLSHSVELKVRWEAACRRIYYSLHLSHSMVNQKQIVGALKNPGRRNMSDMEHEIVRYKKGFDYINSVWLMNQKPIMPQTLQTLYKITTVWVEDITTDGFTIKVGTKSTSNQKLYWMAIW